MNKYQRFSKAPDEPEKYTPSKKCGVIYGKVRYDSHKEARASADIQSEKIGLPLYIYLCPMCQGYHMSKENRSVP